MVVRYVDGGWHGHCHPGWHAVGAAGRPRSGAGPQSLESVGPGPWRSATDRLGFGIRGRTGVRVRNPAQWTAAVVASCACHHPGLADARRTAAGSRPVLVRTGLVDVHGRLGADCHWGRWLPGGNPLSAAAPAPQVQRSAGLVLGGRDLVVDGRAPRPGRRVPGPTS